MLLVNGAKCAIFLINLLLIFNAAVCGAENFVRLELKDEHNHLLFSKKIDPVNGFAIRYTHSVAKTPVTDFFSIHGRDIFLDRTEYKDFGAGLPHAPEDGQKMTVENGRVVISGYNRKLSDLTVRVGRIAGHALLFFENGRPAGEIALNKLLAPGRPITFTVNNNEIIPGD